MNESILCIPSEKIDGIPLGISDSIEQLVQAIYRHSDWHERTDDLEKDDRFRQVVTYGTVCLEMNGSWFHTPPFILLYRRKPKHGQPTLSGKLSIGIGGHIQVEDARKAVFPDLMISGAFEREFGEELGADVATSAAMNHLVIKTVDGAGKYHVGVFALALLSWKDQHKIQPSEEIVDPNFVLPSVIHSHYDSLEPWSRLCLDYLQAPDDRLAELCVTPPAVAGIINAEKGE